MARMRRGLTKVLGFSAVAVLLVGAVVGGVRWRLHQEDAQWPSLQATPPAKAPTAVAAGDGTAWTLLSSVLAMHREIDPSCHEALQAKGRPSVDQLGAWRPHAEALESLRAALNATTGLRIPNPSSQNDPPPNLFQLHKLSEVWLLKAWSDAQAGSTSLALEEMLQVSRLGARLYEGETGLNGVMMGLSIHRKSVTELMELLAEKGVPESALLVQAGAGLTPLKPGGVARGLAQDAVAMEATIWALVDGAEANGEWSGSTLARLTYDPELTLVWHRLQAQSQVNAAAQPAWERRADTGRTLVGDELPWVIRNLHNPAGRVLMSVATVHLEKVIGEEDEAIALARLAVLWIAARRHALDHGGLLPTTQDQLVSVYLPAALVDPYDGQLLKIGGGAVWAAGEGKATHGTALRWSL